jgi:voltage-gated potassium channel
VGVVTGALASWIIQRVAEEETAMQSVTVAHVEELRSEIRTLGQQLRLRNERDARA